MAYDSTLPVAYLEEGPVVTVLGQEELTLLEYAEPSQVMVFASRWWRRFKTMLKVSIIATVVGAYPAAIVASHHIDDSPIALTEQDGWSVPHAGYAVTLIARELEGRGWSGDKANWHPQSRLTAMPAWQEAMANALAEHTELMSMLGAEDGVPDPDLAAAARLLPVLQSQDMRQASTSILCARPSQVMVFASRWWRRFKTMLKVSIIATVVGAYPAAIVASHHIDDSPIALTEQDGWSVPHAGYAVTLIARELEGRGWSGDKANWHHQREAKTIT